MPCRSSCSTATDDYNELPKTAQRILQDMGHYLPTKTIKDTGKLVAENISEHYGNDAEIEPFECRPSITPFCLHEFQNKPASQMMLSTALG